MLSVIPDHGHARRRGAMTPRDDVFRSCLFCLSSSTSLIGDPASLLFSALVKTWDDTLRLRSGQARGRPLHDRGARPSFLVPRVFVPAPSLLRGRDMPHGVFSFRSCRPAPDTKRTKIDIKLFSVNLLTLI